MPTYFVNEASFDLPDGPYADRTVHVVEFPGASGLGLMIARLPMKPGLSLRQTVKEHLDHEAKNLRAWSLLFEREGVVDEQPYLEVGTRFRAEEHPVYQRQIHLGLAGTHLMLVGNGPLSSRGTTDANIERALGTLRFRRG